MKEFWAAHKKKIISALMAIGTTAALIGANVFCNRLPPPFAQICVGAATELVSQARASCPVEPCDGGVVEVQTPARGLEELELCPGGATGPLCTSTGYALPMEDGGRCRCK